VELKPGYKQTEVGVIPEEWKTPTLDSVAKRGSGHTPDKKHLEYWDGDIKWVSLKDSDALDRVYIDETAATITRAGIANSSAVVHPAGTVVLSRDAGVGKSAIMKSAMAVSQHFMAWQCGPCLDNHFLYYWLQSEKSEFERIAIGNTIKTIGLSYFRALNIPLPPLPEQRAIAGALSDVDTLIGALDQLIAKKRDLKQATMQQLLTGQTRLPGFSGKWEVKRLGDVATLNRLNVIPASLPTQMFVHFSLPAFDAGKAPVTEPGAAIGSNKFRVPQGAVLVSKLNPRIPRVWAPDDIPPEAIASTEFLVLTPREGTSRRFLFVLCSSPLFCEQMELAATGTTGSHQRISPDGALSLKVSVPVDVEEQTAIAEVLSDMDAELAALEQRRDKTRSLKQGMMQELLTGKTRLVDSGKLRVESGERRTS
jgi:type I restriction enzyme S subunit